MSWGVGRSLVAVAGRIEPTDPHSGVAERRQNSGGPGIQVFRPQVAGDPRRAQRDFPGLLGDPTAGRNDVERFPGRVRPGGPLIAGVRLPWAHSQADHQIRGGLGARVVVEFGLLAQIVPDRERGIGASLEGFHAGRFGTGPDGGLDRPAGQRRSPFLVDQRDPRPIQAAHLGGLVVLALEQSDDLSGATDRGVQRARLGVGAGAGLGPDNLLAGVLEAGAELAEEAGLLCGLVLGKSGIAGQCQRQERKGSKSCMLHKRPLLTVGSTDICQHGKCGADLEPSDCGLSQQSFDLCRMPAAIPPSRTLGRRLREARQARGMTQAELGAALGLEDENSAAPRISRYERGDRMPDEKTMEALAEKLGLPVAYFHATSDILAEVILLVSQLPASKQKAALEQLRLLAGKEVKR